MSRPSNELETYTHGEEIVQCPRCGTRTQFHEYEDHQLHTCLNFSCLFTFKSVPADPETVELVDRAVERQQDRSLDTIIRDSIQSQRNAALDAAAERLHQESQEAMVAGISREEVEIFRGVVNPPRVVDSNGLVVFSGDAITFSYGIPPVPVLGIATIEDNELWVLTPGHNPDKSKLSELMDNVGEFYVEHSANVAPPPIRTTDTGRIIRGKAQVRPVGASFSVKPKRKKKPKWKSILTGYPPKGVPVIGRDNEGDEFEFVVQNNDMCCEYPMGETEVAINRAFSAWRHH